MFYRITFADNDFVDSCSIVSADNIRQVQYYVTNNFRSVKNFNIREAREDDIEFVQLMGGAVTDIRETNHVN